MKLPALAINNFQFTVILFAILLTFGLSSFMTMPRSEDPYVEFPMAGVTIVAPGISTIDIESGIADPLEEKLNGIEGVEHISSSIEDGLLMIEMEFESDADMEEVESRMNSELTEASKEFPTGVVHSEIWTADILYVKIMQVVVSGENYELRDLWKYADMIKKEFQNVQGTADVEINGYPGEEVEIKVYPEKLSQYKISLMQIYGIIQANNYNIPAGEVRLGFRKFNLRTSGKYESLKQIGATVVGAYDGKPVYLKDIADVEYVYSDPRYKIRYNGKRALILTVEQQEGKDLLNINDDLHASLAAVRNRLPDDLTTHVVFEQADSVKTRTNSFFSNLLQGIILVGIVVLLLIGFRPSIVIMLAIPTSLIIALGIINISGYWIQQMTIAALIISLGLLVDNAIVITENIQRFIDKGMSREEAAKTGSSEVGWAILSATATTVLAFVPMVLMKEESGEYIRSMPVSVAITLISSLFVALTLSPLISRYSLKRSTEAKHSKMKDLFMNFIETRYRPALSYALDNRKKVIISAVVLFFATMMLFPLLGVSFFPPSDKPILLVNVNLPQSASLEKTEQVIIKLEEMLKDEKDVIDTVSNIGRGNPPVYYNMGGAKQVKNFGQILLKLDPDIHVDYIGVLAKKLRNKLDVFPEGKVEVKRFTQGPPAEAPVVIRVIGENTGVLERVASEMTTVMEDIEGLVNINNPMELSSTDMKIEINREEAALRGVNLIDIDRIVRMTVSGLVIGDYQDDEGEIYEMVIRLPERNENWVKSISKIYIPSRSGEQIPLSQLARVVFTPGFSVIGHRDLQRTVSITADAEGRPVSEINRELRAKLDAYDFPVGYKYQLGGEEEARGESFSSMMQATIIAILGIYAVLVLQFRSFLQPVIIYVSLPFAIIGSIFALLLTGYSFSFTAFVGFASLIGIVVNNAIILVDYTNQLIKKGTELREAIITAGATRFRPIIATTLTTIGGLLPLTLFGGELWAPLGLVIIGGLLMSTVLTLIMVPVFYFIFSRHICINC